MRASPTWRRLGSPTRRTCRSRESTPTSRLMMMLSPNARMAVLKRTFGGLCKEIAPSPRGPRVRSGHTPGFAAPLPSSCGFLVACTVGALLARRTADMVHTTGKRRVGTPRLRSVTLGNPVSTRSACSCDLGDTKKLALIFGERPIGGGRPKECSDSRHPCPPPACMQTALRTERCGTSAHICVPLSHPSFQV
jgi:hypothetical protein